MINKTAPLLANNGAVFIRGSYHTIVAAALGARE